MKLLFKPKTMLTALALAACAVGAQADTVQIKTHVAGGTLYADLVNTTDSSYSGPAALWNVQNQTTGDSFLAYCLELLQGADQSNPQTYTSATYNANANVRELYDRFYGTILQSDSQAVGFQLALWELIGSTDVSLFTGTTTNAVSVAESMLTTVASSNTGYTADQYIYTRWSNGTYQDVLQVTQVANAVPEPQTLLLGGLGLMAMGAVSRRKRKHQNA